MKTYDDLTKEEKSKFNGFLNLKSLMKQDFYNTATISFIFLIITELIGALITILSFHLIHIGYTAENLNLMDSASNVLTAGLSIFLFGMIVFLFILVLGFWRQQKDKKLLYSIFEIENISKDLMEIEKGDLKKIKLKYQKEK